MTRRSIPFVCDEYYHVYNRGAGPNKIFFEEDNYQYILRQTYKYARKFQLSIIAYCLLPNHYHYLIRQDGDIPISKFPQSVFGGYSRALHYRYGKSGTLFEGPFKSKHISTDEYLIQVCCYIHANPVRAGLVQHAVDWPYSDCVDWIRWRRAELLGVQGPLELVDKPWTYQQVFNVYIRSKKTPEELSYLDEY